MWAVCSFLSYAPDSVHANLYHGCRFWSVRLLYVKLINLTLNASLEPFQLKIERIKLEHTHIHWLLYPILLCAEFVKWDFVHIHCDLLHEVPGSCGDWTKVVLVVLFGLSIDIGCITRIGNISYSCTKWIANSSDVSCDITKIRLGQTSSFN